MSTRGERRRQERGIDHCVNCAKLRRLYNGYCRACVPLALLGASG